MESLEDCVDYDEDPITNNEPSEIKPETKSDQTMEDGEATPDAKVEPVKEQKKPEEKRIIHLNTSSSRFKPRHREEAFVVNTDGRQRSVSSHWDEDRSSRAKSVGPSDESRKRARSKSRDYDDQLYQRRQEYYRDPDNKYRSWEQGLQRREV